MSLVRTIMILLSSFLFYTLATAQAKRNVFQNYLDKVQGICHDSNYKRVLTCSADSHSWLAGYSKSDGICLIVESFEVFYGRQECTFLFHSGDLIFVVKKQINTKKVVDLNTYSDTTAYLKFEGFYRLSKGKIIDSKVIGEENEREPFDNSLPYPFKRNSAKYFLFVAQLDKHVLSKKTSVRNCIPSQMITP